MSPGSQGFVLPVPDVFVPLVVNHVPLGQGTLDCQCLSPAPGFLPRGYSVDVVMVLYLCLPLDCLGLPQGPLRVSGLTLCPTLSHLW